MIHSVWFLRGLWHLFCRPLELIKVHGGNWIFDINKYAINPRNLPVAKVIWVYANRRLRLWLLRCAMEARSSQKTKIAWIHSFFHFGDGSYVVDWVSNSKENALFHFNVIAWAGNILESPLYPSLVERTKSERWHEFPKFSLRQKSDVLTKRVIICVYEGKHRLGQGLTGFTEFSDVMFGSAQGTHHNSTTIVAGAKHSMGMQDLALVLTSKLIAHCLELRSKLEDVSRLILTN